MTHARRIGAGAILLSAWAVLLHSVPLAVKALKSGMDPERLALIRVRMKSFVDQGTIAGTVTLVARRHTLASLEAVGYQDLETRTPMRTDTIFQIMSMTKPVTATGVMILAEEGKLSLGDPVEKYLPEFQGMWVIQNRDGNKAMSLTRTSRRITYGTEERDFVYVYRCVGDHRLSFTTTVPIAPL